MLSDCGNSAAGYTRSSLCLAVGLGCSLLCLLQLLLCTHLLFSIRTALICNLSLMFVLCVYVSTERRSLDRMNSFHFVAWPKKKKEKQPSVCSASPRRSVCEDAECACKQSAPAPNEFLHVDFAPPLLLPLLPNGSPVVCK